MIRLWLSHRHIVQRLLAMALMLGVGFYTPIASAHAMLVKSDPGRRAALNQTPTQVRLWFNERLEAAYSSASVAKSDGTVVSTPAAAIAPDDPKLLVIKLPALDAGAYEVRYRVLSVDGHIIESKFNFTIKPKSTTPKAKK